MRRVLVTAFEPFDGRKLNTSAEILRFLPETIAECSVGKMLLPVVFGKAAERVLREPADAVFLLGEAGGRDMVTPELRAVNYRRARIPDHEGNQPDGETILPDGPEYYCTPIPVQRITAQMQGEGYAIDVSKDAGTYVCNDTFYSVGIRLQAPVAFIHSPADPEKAPVYAETIRRFIEIAVSGESKTETL